MDLGDQGKDTSLLYEALDQLTRRYGNGILHVACTGMQVQSSQWDMKHERRTPRYTADTNDIPIARYGG